MQRTKRVRGRIALFLSGVLFLGGCGGGAGGGESQTEESMPDVGAAAETTDDITASTDALAAATASTGGTGQTAVASVGKGTTSTAGKTAVSEKGLLGVTFAQSAGDIRVDWKAKTVTIPVRGDANLQGKRPVLQVSAGYTAVLSDEGGDDLNAHMVYRISGGKEKERWTVMTEEVYTGIPDAKQLSAMSLFAKGAVLQRDKPIRVWGTCEGAEMVTVEFAGQKKRAAVTDGRWEAVLDPLPANDRPRDMILRTAGRTITFADILVGDVWLCSGQSNMVHFVKYLDSSYWADYQAIADNEQIRYFYVPNSYDKEPMDDFVSRSKWQKPSAANVLGFSAYAYGFAYRIQKELGIPIGIIDSSVGASIIEEWLPDSSLKAAGTTRQEALHNQELPQYGTGMYNSMIYPMRGLAIRGVLWYQGESNVNATSDYKALFREFASHYRGLFKDEKLPIVATQIVKFQDATRPKWPKFRVTQWEAARESGAYIVCGIDMGDRTNIHPNDKLPLATRAAELTLNKVYTKRTPGESAYPLSATINGNTVTIRFRDAESGLVVKGGEMVQELYGRTEDGDFVFPEEVAVKGDTLVMTVKKPVVQVDYAMSQMPEGNLYTANGLPVAPFSRELTAE